MECSEAGCTAVEVVRATGCHGREEGQCKLNWDLHRGAAGCFKWRMREMARALTKSGKWKLLEYSSGFAHGAFSSGAYRRQVPTFRLGDGGLSWDKQ